MMLYLRISSDYWPPSQTLVEDGCKSRACFKGYYADIFYTFQEIMNFTFTVRQNGIAGAKLPNGTWIGQIGNYKVTVVSIVIICQTSKKH